MSIRVMVTWCKCHFFPPKKGDNDDVVCMCVLVTATIMIHYDLVVDKNSLTKESLDYEIVFVVVML